MKGIPEFRYIKNLLFFFMLIVIEKCCRSIILLCDLRLYQSQGPFSCGTSTFYTLSLSIFVLLEYILY